MPEARRITSPSESLDRMVRVINDGWLVAILSLGERTGLSNALSDQPQPLSAIASAASCDERYSEIWLWAMVASGFVESSDSNGVTHFTLAPGAHRVLTSAGGPEHWARISQQIMAFATLEDQLTQAFHTGEGLAAGNYEGRITEVLASESTPILTRTVIDEVFPAFNINALCNRGARIVDFGCGDGTLACQLGERFPLSTVTGIDQSTDAIQTGRGLAHERRLNNVTFVVADLENEIPVSDVDIAMAVNVVHDLSDPVAFYRRVKEALRPDGLLYQVELSSDVDMAVNATNPHALGILGFSLYHCLPLAKRRKGIAPGGMYGTQRYLAALEAAGFAQCTVTRAPSDPTNDTIIARHSPEMSHDKH